MYGNHKFEKALEIANDKTAETGVQHVVVPCGDEAPGLFTVGREIKSTSVDEIMQRIKSKLGAQRGEG